MSKSRRRDSSPQNGQVGERVRVATYIQHHRVRVYLFVGEPEKALDRLEPLLKIPYYLSPGWLRIDPTFSRGRAGASAETAAHEYRSNSSVNGDGGAVPPVGPATSAPSGTHAIAAHPTPTGPGAPALDQQLPKREVPDHRQRVIEIPLDLEIAG